MAAPSRTYNFKVGVLHCNGSSSAYGVYDCWVYYNACTRSGGTVTLNSAVLYMKRQSSKYSTNRIAYQWYAGSISRSNTQIKKSGTASAAEYSIDLGSPTWDTVNSSVSVTIEVASTGASSGWNNFSGKISSTTSISCPAGAPTYTTSPSVSTTDETSISINLGATDMSSTLYYKVTNVDADWVSASGTVNKTGLSPNTTYSVSFKAAANGLETSGGSGSATTWTTPAISSISTSSLIAGNSQTVNISNPHQRNCSIKVYCGSNELYSTSTTSTSATFTIPVATCYGANALNTGTSTTTSVNLTYKCTYGSWETSTTGTLNHNTGKVPSWSANFAINTAVTYQDTNTTIVNITGSNQTLVQGKSSWKYTLALTGDQAAIVNSDTGSSIKQYQVSVNGGDWTNVSATATNTVGTVGSTASSVTVAVRALDYKGSVTATKTRTITVTPYRNPTGSITASRVGGYGTTAQLRIDPSWAINNNNKGTAAVSYSTSKTGTYTSIGTTSTFNSYYNLSPSFNNNNTYYIKVVLTDKLGAVSEEIITSFGPGQPLMFIDETVTGVGVNQIPNGKGLYVDGTIISTGSVRGKNVHGTNGNKNNYPYHRIAHVGPISANWSDRNIILRIIQGYNGGHSGTIKICLRTNDISTTASASVEAIWETNNGFTLDQIQVALYSAAKNVYADVYYKCNGNYASITVEEISSGIRGSLQDTWTLINSQEVDNTTTTDKKTSIEVYSSIANAATELYNVAYTSTINSTSSIVNSILSTWPVNSIYLSVNNTSPASIFGGSWTALTGGYYLKTITSGTGGGTGGDLNTSSVTLTAAQSGLRDHGHSVASASYTGANFYIRHGSSEGTDSVAAGAYTWIDERTGSTWGNGFSTATYSHPIDRVNIGGGVSVSISNSGSANATEGHSHTINPSYIQVYAWKRTA